jgi:hypothetical protein
VHKRRREKQDHKCFEAFMNREKLTTGKNTGFINVLGTVSLIEIITIECMKTI